MQYKPGRAWISCALKEVYVFVLSANIQCSCLVCQQPVVSQCNVTRVRFYACVILVLRSVLRPLYVLFDALSSFLSISFDLFCFHLCFPPFSCCRERQEPVNAKTTVGHLSEFIGYRTKALDRLK